MKNSIFFVTIGLPFKTFDGAIDAFADPGCDPVDPHLLNSYGFCPETSAPPKADVGEGTIPASANGDSPTPIAYQNLNLRFQLSTIEQ